MFKKLKEKFQKNKINKEVIHVEENLIVPKQEMLDIIKYIYENNKKEALEITNINIEDVDILGNKVGGDFLFDSTMQNEIDNMFLLFQINFSKVPKNSLLPKKGILQFFIANNTKLFGMKDLDKDKEYKVFFHEDETKLDQQFPSVIKAKVDQEIIKREFSFDFEKKVQHLTTTDYRFEDILKKELIKRNIDIELLKEKNQYYDFHDVYFDYDNEENYANVILNHSLGYATHCQEPFFTKGKEYELLFQISSTYFEEELVFQLGDDGILNVFIEKEDLLNKTFDNVHYTWDNY